MACWAAASISGYPEEPATEADWTLPSAPTTMDKVTEPLTALALQGRREGRRCGSYDVRRRSRFHGVAITWSRAIATAASTAFFRMTLARAAAFGAALFMGVAAGMAVLVRRRRLVLFLFVFLFFIVWRYFLIGRDGNIDGRCRG